MDVPVINKPLKPAVLRSLMTRLSRMTPAAAEIEFPAIEDDSNMTVHNVPRLPSFEDVRKAAERIAGAAHRTPVLTSRTADAAYRRDPLSSRPRTCSAPAPSSFAALTMRSPRWTPSARKRGVIAFSSGNHAQAIAYAAALQGAPSTIVMPSDAPAIKVAATRGYGAEVVFYDRYTEDRRCDQPASCRRKRRDAYSALRPS